MSNVSNTHDIKPYTSGVTKPFNGQRLATVTYKTDKVSGIKPASVAVSVPAVNVADVHANIASFIPHIIALVERTQDGIVRAAHEAGRSAVSDDEISVSAVIAALNEEGNGRLTKESINNWFDETISDPLAIALAQKLGVSETPSAEDSAKVDQLLASFRNSISALSAGATKYDPKTCDQLLKALSFAPETDVIAQKFSARLENMKKTTVSSIADAL